MLSKLKNNASGNFIVIVVGIFTSYWVTIFDKITNESLLEGFLQTLKINYFFLFINLIILLVIILALYNLYIVYKINYYYIPQLKQILSNNIKSLTPEKIKDSFASLHSYFDILEIKDNSTSKIIEIIIKPKEIQTHLLPLKKIKFSIKFIDEKYDTYTYEDEKLIK